MPKRKKKAHGKAQRLDGDQSSSRRHANGKGTKGGRSPRKGDAVHTRIRSSDVSARSRKVRSPKAPKKRKQSPHRIRSEAARKGWETRKARERARERKRRKQRARSSALAAQRNALIAAVGKKAKPPRTKASTPGRKQLAKLDKQARQLEEKRKRLRNESLKVRRAQEALERERIRMAMSQGAVAEELTSAATYL